MYVCGRVSTPLIRERCMKEITSKANVKAMASIHMPMEPYFKVRVYVCMFVCICVCTFIFILMYTCVIDFDCLSMKIYIFLVDH